MRAFRAFVKWFRKCNHTWCYVGVIGTTEISFDMFECERCGRRESVRRVIQVFHD